MMHRTLPRNILAMMIVLILGAMPVLAQDVPTLQVSPSAGSKAQTPMTIAALDALPQTGYATTTIWTDGETTFTGVPLKTLLAHLGAQGARVELIALNDYSVTIPLSELEDDAPIVATRMNGAPMSVRDKGPYWVVYPYDRDAKYQNETVYSRSIWQLNRLKIVD